MEQMKLTQVFGISPDEFKESIIKDIRTEIKTLSQSFQPITPAEYLTRKEIADILKISLVTLSDWNRKKILKPYRLGKLIRYKRSDIDLALISINSNN